METLSSTNLALLIYFDLNGLESSKETPLGQRSCNRLPRRSRPRSLSPPCHPARRAALPAPAGSSLEPRFCENQPHSTFTSLTTAQHSPLSSIRRFTPKNGEKRGTEGTGQFRQGAPHPALAEQAVHIQSASVAAGHQVDSATGGFAQPGGGRARPCCQGRMLQPPAVPWERR